MKKFIEEFKEFAIQGNAIQMAVGVVIGAAFGSIVSSLVKDIIMPLVGILTKSVSFSHLVLVINGAEIAYGSFIQATIDFTITAFSIFMIIRAMNRLTHKKEIEEIAEEEAPDTNTVLLENILKELKKQNKK